MMDYSQFLNSFGVEYIRKTVKVLSWAKNPHCLGYSLPESGYASVCMNLTKYLEVDNHSLRAERVGPSVMKISFSAVAS